jgi:hypothetical protein
MQVFDGGVGARGGLFGGQTLQLLDVLIMQANKKCPQQSLCQPGLPPLACKDDQPAGSTTCLEDNNDD